MGSSGESIFVPGNQSVDHAYAQAVNEARREFGSDPYNGTISTSGGFHVYSHLPVTMAEANVIYDREMDNLTKWESWGAVAIMEDGEVERRVIEKRFKVDTPTTYAEELKPIITPQLALKAGEIVEGIEILEDNMTWRPEVDTPDGDRTVVYLVHGVQALDNKRYSTLAAARAATLEAARTWGTPVPGYGGKFDVPWQQRQPMAATIYGTVDRGRRDGRTVPMLNVRTTLRNRTVKVKITLIRPIGGGQRKLGGWFFFGWAAC